MLIDSMKNADRYMRLLRDNAKAKARAPLAAEMSGEDEATVYLYDMIVSSEFEADWWGGIAPESFINELNSIEAGTIHLRINSPGGSIFAARAIEAAIRGHKSKIVAHVDGYAASAASFIAVACDEVEMAKGAFFMIHKGWSCMCGNSDDFMDAAALLEKIDGTLAGTYADKTGKSVKEMLDLMAAETWFTAQESVDIGLADRITDNEAKASAWDLSAYDNAPVKAEAEPEPTAEPEAETDNDPEADAAMLRNRLALKERE